MKRKRDNYNKAGQGSFLSVGTILKDFKQDEDKYISREFQQYGYDLAKELDDLKNKSLYIKLAKDTPRGLLEATRTYIKDAHEVKNPAALFLWKLKQLKDEKKEKKKEAVNPKSK